MIIQHRMDETKKFRNSQARRSWRNHQVFNESDFLIINDLIVRGWRNQRLKMKRGMLLCIRIMSRPYMWHDRWHAHASWGKATCSLVTSFQRSLGSSALFVAWALQVLEAFALGRQGLQYSPAGKGVAANALQGMSYCSGNPEILFLASLTLLVPPPCTPPPS